MVYTNDISLQIINYKSEDALSGRSHEMGIGTDPMGIGQSVDHAEPNFSPTKVSNGSSCPEKADFTGSFINWQWKNEQLFLQ
jgi:hypothetical protein